jgi:ribosome-associated protein
VKERLLALHDSRITKAGELIIKAQQHRTQDMNRLDAMLRLHEIVNSVEFAPITRKATKPSRASKLRRLDTKSQRSDTKVLRSKVARSLND